MEVLIGLLFFVLVVGVVASLVMALIALLRAGKHRELDRQSAQFDRRLARVETRLAEAQQGLRALREQADVESRERPTTAETASDLGERVVSSPPPPHVVVPSSSPSLPSVDPGPPPPPPGDGPPARRGVEIDWERWIGIRGAAVLGAVALGLAGLLFFKYSIERGLITPVMRVVLGTLTGIGCLVGSEWLRRRKDRYAADGVAGAGVVILYAAFWAAHVRYELIGMLVAFGLMALVTVVCCLLAVRRASLLVAVLGLVGGFATPLLLSSGSDRPIGLFGYVLLLDLGLLTVGQKRGWPSLGLLSLLGTVLLQGLWIVNRMGPDRLLLGLAILAVFGALFVVAGRFGPDREPTRGWLASQVGAIFFPFVFAVYLAGRVDLGPHLWPTALLLALLCAAAAWLAREQGVHVIGMAAATASVAVVAVWLTQRTLTLSLAWEVALTAVGLAAIFHLFVERQPESTSDDGPAFAALISFGGFFVLLLFAAAGAQVPAWPWLAAWVLLAALAYRQAIFPGRAALQVGAAIGLGFGLSILHRFDAPILPPTGWFLTLLVAAVVVLQIVALRRTAPVVRRWADHASATLPVLLLVLLPGSLSTASGPAAALGTTLVLAALALWSATRLGAGAWYAATVGATFFVHLVWTSNRPGLRGNSSESLAALLIETLAVVVLTAWPFLAGNRFATQRLAWYAAALAGPLWFLPMLRLFEWRFGDGFIGALPVLLGALSAIAADRARRTFARSDPFRLSAIVWFAAVGLCFVAVAIPLQLEREWVTIGWALQGFAVIALWTRLDHPGLKYFGLALIGAAAMRLIANPALLGYHSRSAMRILNWLLYTYLVPAAAMLGAARLLQPRERERARSWEEALYARGQSVGAIASGLAAILVVFVWINLAIADWFATGPTLTLSFGDRPAQRLIVSIAWALYALVLLGFGMARNSRGLRWLSLCFLLVTIGKVFLYDLGALRDLYRVASLVGLALSLILVSVLYQRFVFRRRDTEEP